MKGFCYLSHPSNESFIHQKIIHRGNSNTIPFSGMNVRFSINYKIIFLFLYLQVHKVPVPSIRAHYLLRRG